MEQIKDKNGKLIAIIDHIYNIPQGLNFYTQDSDHIQVASFKYDQNHIMKPHKHLWHSLEFPMESWKTQECLFVYEGLVQCNIYDDENNEIYSFSLHGGHYLILFNGGVGYKILMDNTKMLEFKAGKFPGSEKDRALI